MTANDADELDASLKGKVTGTRAGSRSNPVLGGLDVDARVMMAIRVGMAGNEDRW